jgi:actin-related protein 5
MAPSAIDSLGQPSEQGHSVPPATLYPPREAYFEQYITPQPEGYRKAKSLGPEKAAIVIDNGS